MKKPFEVERQIKKCCKISRLKEKNAYSNSIPIKCRTSYIKYAKIMPQRIYNGTLIVASKLPPYGMTPSCFSLSPSLAWRVQNVDCKQANKRKKNLGSNRRKVRGLRHLKRKQRGIRCILDVPF